MKWLLCICVVFLTHPAFALRIDSGLLRAIEAKDWPQSLTLSSSSSTVRSYLQWRIYQDADVDVSFEMLAQFIDAHPDWPALRRLRVRAEKQLFQDKNQSNAAKSFLTRHTPISGYGMFALARISPNRELIRKGWTQGDFERNDETQIIGEFRKSLNQATHQARAERLLSERKASIAERLLDFVGNDYAALYRARIAVQRKERGLDAKISRIPAKLKNDHGLLADRLQWRHRKGLAKGTRELLLQMRADSSYADKLWRIRASYVRDAIEDGAYTQAAMLLKNSGILSAGNQADALWLKGWLELTFRKNAKAAYQHFTQLHQSVSYPVSKSRGAYWSAKAAQNLGDDATALTWLQQAALHPTTFYGQLAFAQLEPNKPLRLPASPSANSTAYRHYRDHPLMQLAIAFHEANLDKLSMPLLYQLTQSASNKGEFAALMKLCVENKMLHGQVRVAKMAMRKHIILREGWPMVSPPAGSPLPAELALAISRQESEFNPIAVSHANARGLMQLLPSTARKTASKIDMSYSLSKLFDPQFNMRLGSQYLADLIEGFDGNYILAIAGYNAGPSRSRQWVERFNWPGKDLTDTLTFLELIPFSETRNYVQRVLENVQTYRALRKPDAALMLKQDLLR